MEIIEITTNGWIILCIGALLAGFIDSIAGGGGLIAIPAFLIAGVPPHHAIATNKLQSIFGTSVAGYNYLQAGNTNQKAVVIGIISTFIGSIIGSIVILSIPSKDLDLLIPIILLIVFLLLLINKPEKKESIGVKKSILPINKYFFIFGLIIGFYDGFFGPGTGTIWYTTIILILRLNLINTLAYTKIMNITSNLGALIIFIWQGKVLFMVGIIMAIFQMIGGYLGSKIAIKKGNRIVKPLILIVILVTILKVIYTNIF